MSIRERLENWPLAETIGLVGSIVITLATAFGFAFSVAASISVLSPLSLGVSMWVSCIGLSALGGYVGYAEHRRVRALEVIVPIIEMLTGGWIYTVEYFDVQAEDVNFKKTSRGDCFFWSRSPDKKDAMQRAADRLSETLDPDLQPKHVGWICKGWVVKPAVEDTFYKLIAETLVGDAVSRELEPDATAGSTVSEGDASVSPGSHAGSTTSDGEVVVNPDAHETVEASSKES